MGMEFDMVFKNMPGAEMMSGVFGVAAGAFIAVMIVFALIGLALSVATYVLRSIGCYKIAKRRGIHHPWLAWIPIGDSWILGSISDQYQYVAKGKIRNRRKALLGLTIATVAVSIPVSIAEAVVGVQTAMGYGMDAVGVSIVIGVCSVVMAILSMIAAVIQYIAFYDLFASCEPDNSVLYLVLSIVFAVTLPVFLFICRNKDGGMPPRKQPRQETEQPRWEEPQEEIPVLDDVVTDEDFETEE